MSSIRLIVRVRDKLPRRPLRRVAAAVAAIVVFVVVIVLGCFPWILVVCAGREGTRAGKLEEEAASQPASQVTSGKQSSAFLLLKFGEGKEGGKMRNREER